MDTQTKTGKMYRVGLVAIGLGGLGTLGLFVLGSIVYPGSDAELLDRAKATVNSMLFDPSSAQFDRVRIVKLGQTRIACGLVNAKNRFGGYVGKEPFMFDGSYALLYNQKEASQYDLRINREKILACDRGANVPPSDAELKEMEEKRQALQRQKDWEKAEQKAREDERRAAAVRDQQNRAPVRDHTTTITFGKPTR